MDELNRLLTDNMALVIALLVALLLILLVVAVVQSIRLGRAVRDYRSLMGGGSGTMVGRDATLGEVLEAHIGRVDAVAEQLGEMRQVHASLEHRALTSLQHIGLVRFNPFEDTGSDQSFAIALLDGQRDGIVISSLHGRANTRVFAKPVQAGTSPHALSTEEEQAIRIAVSGTGRAADG